MENPRPSFSSASRWKIGCDIALRTALVLAVAVMVNWLGAKFYKRFYWSEQTRVELSSRTLTLIQTLTNHVEVTLYYDKHDQFYPDILELLNAYRDANKNISIHAVDYTRDPAEAMKVKEKFNLPATVATPNAPPSKDLIIFACGDRHDIIPGAAIIGTETKPIGPGDPNYEPDIKGPQYLRKPVNFHGELRFTSTLFALAHGQPLPAYFLQGHGERSLADTDAGGYKKFALTLVQNDIALKNLELSGHADVPADCSLLVIAAPVRAIDPADLEKIDRYLAQGGKLLVLLDYFSINKPTGLESVLQHWGVNVMADYVKDPRSANEQVAIVRNFNRNTFVAPLWQLALEMILPRPVLKMESPASASAPQVEALVASDETSTLASERTSPPRSYTLIAAVEQKPAAGVVAPRGSTRLVVAGDSMFLDNELIEAAANRDFLDYAANWLCDRGQLLSGINPRPVTEFRLLVSKAQQRELNWLLLGALPGGILIFGWLVWLVRRK